MIRRKDGIQVEKGPQPEAFKDSCTHQELADASVCGEEAVGYRFLDRGYVTLQLTWCAAGHVIVADKIDFYKHTVWDFVTGEAPWIDVWFALGRS